MPPNYGAGLAAKYSNAIAAQNGQGQQPPPPPKTAEEAELERQFLAGAQTSAAPPPWEIQSGAPNPVANIPQIGSSEGMSTPSAPAPTAPAPAQPGQPLLLPGRSWAGGPNATARMLTQESPTLQASIAGQFAAEQQSALAEAAGNDQLAEREAEVQRRMQASMNDERAAQERYRNAERETLMSLQADTDRIAKMAPTQKSAGEYLGQMSTGNKIAAVVGLALGGLGEAITGKSNPALSQLEKLTEQDLANQQRAYAAAKDAGAKRATVYGQLLERYQDPVIAERQYRAFQADQLGRYAQQVASTTKSAQMRAKAEGLAAQFQGKAAEQRMEIAKGIAANTSAGGSTGPSVNPLAVQEYLARGGSMEELQKSIAAGKAMGMSPAVAAAAHIGSGATGAPDPKAREHEDKQVESLSKRFSEADISSGINSINTINSIADSGEGVGLIAGKLSESPATSWVLNDKQRENQQKMRTAQLGFKKAWTGLGGSDKEAENLWNTFVGPARDQAGLRTAAKMMEDALKAKAAEIRAGYSPETNARFDAQAARSGMPVLGSKVQFKEAGK